MTLQHVLYFKSLLNQNYKYILLTYPIHSVIFFSVFFFLTWKETYIAIANFHAEMFSNEPFVSVIIAIKKKKRTFLKLICMSIFGNLKNKTRLRCKNVTWNM